MKVKSKELLRALKQVSPAVSTNKIIPILEYVKIECDGTKGVVTATDTNLTCICEFELLETSKESLLVPFNELEKLCGLTTEIQFDKNLIIKSGEEKWQIGEPEDVNHFSTHPEVDDAIQVDVNSDFFFSMSQSLKTTDQKPELPYHNVFLEVSKTELTVFSYGNSALYVDKIANTSKGEITVSIPPAFVKATQKMQEAKLSVSDRNIKAETDGFTVISSLADCKPFVYKNVYLRNKESNCTINKNDLLSSIYKIEALKNTLTFHQVDITLSEKQLKLNRTDSNIKRAADVYCPCENSSELKTIFFDSFVLKNALSQANSDIIGIRFNESHMPIIITDETVTIFVSPMTKNS